MSLDVYLNANVEPEKHECLHCDGKGYTLASTQVYESNITHNLGRMAEEAGIYKHLWRPEEIGITKACQLIEPLKEGLKMMRSDPERFKKFNSPNNWGLYENFVPWVQEYLWACEEYPDANISVSR